MRFKIVSAGWNCAPYARRTLDSIAAQSRDNWDLGVVVDPSTDGTENVVRDWWRERAGEVHGEVGVYFTGEQQFAVRNQVETIDRLDPDPEDVIVFLDLDGDQFAHPDVLAHLEEYYADGTLVTYGNYRPVPANTGCCPPKPFPSDVVRGRAYRNHVLTSYCSFNHLRTMKAKVYRAIPPEYFRWGHGRLKGQWYPAGTDYAFMCAALELADGRYRCIKEVLCLYNSENPHADTLEHGPQSTKCHQDILRRQPLPRLEETGSSSSSSSELPETQTPVQTPPGPGPTEVELFMTAEERRQVLREYGQKFDLNVLIETGTNDGGTPWELKDDFAAIYTIELGRRQWRAARSRFAEHPHVRCLHGDSIDVLPTVLAEVTEPALVWLDGHYSGPGTAHGTRSTPIREELGILLTDGRPHVIMVDDARIFEGGPEHDLYDHYADYPSLEWVEERATRAGYDFTLEDDIMRLVPRA